MKFISMRVVGTYRDRWSVCLCAVEREKERVLNFAKECVKCHIHIIQSTEIVSINTKRIILRQSFRDDELKI